ncbi:sigma-70 family RNA polymerase sigma factor [Streptomyces sp. WM6378]|uniref:sigma-70 family RNA polymerase sigma factor n=1 Tax=Streptomyces sp. WM6378 TaxID=1415557 RepID=UPI0006AFE24D|nr:sigma-70 family RNA polymerase sigma factor [Streptomyces sp. WM6378]
MTEPPQDPAEYATREPSEAMPPAFWAFHARYHRPYLEYARIHLGDDEAAHDLVDGTFIYLAVVWGAATEQENIGSYAWVLLKERVWAELAMKGRDPAAAETLAFARAVCAATDPILDSFRAQFRQQITELEETMGLFAAMARLPERQFDVIVLQFALDFDTKTTALVMGIREATVRSIRRTAKRRLAAELGLGVDEDTDDEE